MRSEYLPLPCPLDLFARVFGWRVVVVLCVGACSLSSSLSPVRRRVVVVVESLRRPSVSSLRRSCVLCLLLCPCASWSLLSRVDAVVALISSMVFRIFCVASVGRVTLLACVGPWRCPFVPI